mgnify:CR=1 FL=1
MCIRDSPLDSGRQGLLLFPLALPLPSCKLPILAQGWLGPQGQQALNTPPREDDRPLLEQFPRSEALLLCFEGDCIAPLRETPNVLATVGYLVELRCVLTANAAHPLDQAACGLGHADAQAASMGRGHHSTQGSCPEPAWCIIIIILQVQMSASWAPLLEASWATRGLQVAQNQAFLHPRGFDSSGPRFPFSRLLHGLEKVGFPFLHHGFHFTRMPARNGSIALK